MIYPWEAHPDHPKANSWGYVHTHTITAERALGKPLPEKAVIHHHGSTLIICEDQRYHMLLHMRTRAHVACGLAHFHRCHKCGQWLPPQRFHSNKSTASGLHSACKQCRSKFKLN